MDKGYAAWAARWRVRLGFALGVAYPVFAQPSVELLIAGGAIALAGLALRAFAAGYLEKNQALAKSGPYRFTRNPLYLGSTLMGLGFAVAGGSWAVGVGFLALFALVYWPVMRREEAFLRAQFKEAYDRYAQAVPLFFPVFFRSRRATHSGEKFLWARYRKNREDQAALGYATAIVFLALKMGLR